MNIENAIMDSVKSIFAGDCSGHDYWHTMRVYKNAMKLVENEVCDKQVVMLAALLHDVDDVKLFTTENDQNARDIMSKCKMAKSTQENVIKVIHAVSFKGNASTTPETIEGKIVQDADRLDAIGAIGIARAFAYGGSRGRSIYDPEVEPLINMNVKEYQQNKRTTINHFYEKLFQLKSMMNTETARKMAEERDQYMHEFIDEFYAEWDGER